MVKVIVTGVDGSATAAEAARTAAELAVALNAELHVLSAYGKFEATTFVSGDEEIVFDSVKDAERTAGEALNALRRSFPRLTMTAAPSEGKPAEALVKAAERLGARIIVVGNKRTQGLGRMRRAMSTWLTRPAAERARTDVSGVCGRTHIETEEDYVIDLGETTMNREEIDAYLREDGRFAAVGTVRKDGSPFTIPLGYYYDGQFLYFSTTPTRGVAKRLRRDPRISVCVFDHEAIHGYVLVNGTVEEIDDPGDHYSLAMHHRYPKPGLDPEEHDAIWLSEGRVVFRISTQDAFGMDQRKATSVHALAMPDRPGLKDAGAGASD